jgi:hypothetical protein
MTVLNVLRFWRATVLFPEGLRSVIALPLGERQYGVTSAGLH